MLVPQQGAMPPVAGGYMPQVHHPMSGPMGTPYAQHPMGAYSPQHYAPAPTAPGPVHGGYGPVPGIQYQMPPSYGAPVTAYGQVQGGQVVQPSAPAPPSYTTGPSYAHLGMASYQ